LSLTALALMAALAASALFLWNVARRDNQHLITEKEQLDQEIATAQQEKGELGQENAQLGQENARLADDIEAKRHESRVQSVRQIGLLYSLGNAREALENLTQYDKEFPQSRDLFDVSYLRGLFKSNTRVLEGHTAPIRAIHVSEDGRSFATAA